MRAANWQILRDRLKRSCLPVRLLRALDGATEVEVSDRGTTLLGVRASPPNLWATRLADLLVKTEPLWVIPALAFTCTTLLWGLGWSWVGLVVAAASFPLRRWRLGRLSRRTPFEVPVVLCLVASAVGLAVSPDRGVSLMACQSVLACVLLYYSLVNMPHSASIQWLFGFAVVGVFLASILALRAGFTAPSAAGGFGTWVQEVLQHLPQVPRLSKIADPVMSTAHGLAIAVEMVLLPLIGLVMFAARTRIKAVAALMSVPFLLLLVLVGSQGAWLAMGAGLALLLVWRSRWAVLPAAATVGLGYLGHWQGWIHFRSVVSEFGPSRSLTARVELWKGATDVIRDHAIAGCGLGCLGKYSTTAFLSPHNAYLQFYADMGLAGAFALVGALVIGGMMAVDLAKVRGGGLWYGFAVGILAAGVAVGCHGVFEGSPAGIYAETADGYYYIVSPVAAILAGLFVRTCCIVEESIPLRTSDNPPPHPPT